MVIYLGNICPGIFIKYVSFLSKNVKINPELFVHGDCECEEGVAIDLSPVLFPTVKDFLLFSCSGVFVQIDCLHV